MERKRKKRAKKEAAEKNAREKEEHAKKQKEEKDAKTATTWRAKLAPVLLSCKTLGKTKDFSAIPEWAKETLEAEVQSLVAMDKTLAAVENKKAHLKLSNEEVSLSWIIWAAIRLANSSLGSDIDRYFLRYDHNLYTFSHRSDQDRYGASSE